METAGYGTGNIVELPIELAGEGFVSVELKTDGSYNRVIKLGQAPLALPGVE